MSIDLKVKPNKNWDLNNWTHDNDSQYDVVKSKLDRVIFMMKDEQDWFDLNYYSGIDWQYIIDNKDIIKTNTRYRKLSIFLANVKNNVSEAMSDLPFFVKLNNIDIGQQQDKDNNTQFMLNIEFEASFDNKEIKTYKENYLL